MSYTLAEAAAACGINKSTVLRAVKSGRISGTKDEGGTWHVEAVELHRVFPAAPASRDVVPYHAPTDAATDALVAALREQLTELRAVIADLRGERDRLLKALPTPKPAPKPNRTFWQWLFESRVA
jgi:excisionase family DNA binding protein